MPQRSIERNKIKKVLIVKGPGIGDVITTVPIARNFKKFLNCEIHVFEEFPPEKIGTRLISGCPYIDKIVRFDYSIYAINPRWGAFSKEVLTLKFIPDSLKFIRDVIRLRKQKYDLIFEGFPGTFETYLLSRLVGARYYVCCSSNPKKSKYETVLDIKGKNIVETENSFFEKIGFTISEKERELDAFFKRDEVWVDKFFKENGIKKKDMLVGINTGQSYKRWQNYKWAELLGRIKNVKIFYFGDKSQEKDMEEIKNLCKKEFIDLTGKTSIEEAAMLMEKMNMFVGVNGGLAWVAAALKIPSIIISGPTPYWWDPRTKKTVVLRRAGKSFYEEDQYKRQQNARTEDITVDEAVKEMNKILPGVAK